MMGTLNRLIAVRAPSEPRYFCTIDLFRGIAALVVVTFHYCNFYVAPGGLHATIGYPGAMPLYGVLWPIYKYGAFAVQFFWLISGFVFADVYVGRRHSTRQFVTSRIARLYPLHFLTLIVVAFLKFGRLTFIGNFAIYPVNNLYELILHIFMISS